MWSPRIPYPKQMLDLLLALVLVVPCLVVALCLAGLVWLQDPGPAFFVQRRLGRGGASFPMIKLRTMSVHGDAILERHFLSRPEVRARYEQTGALADDPRIVSPIAALARKYYLDELPQVLNVLRGDMSFVGPRPLERWLAAGLMTSAELRQRCRVRPGITGLAQVKRHAKSDIGRRMINLDLHYAQHCSPSLDGWIMMKTIHAVLSGGGIETGRSAGKASVENANGS